MKNETKHTPGPWEVRQESIDPEWSVVTTKSGSIIANVNSESGPDIPPLVSKRMPKDANARLIAAAPDLLDALEDCAGVLASIEKQLNGKSVAVSEVLKKALETIAQAKGETP